MQQSSSPLPFSLREYLAGGGDIVELPDEAQEELAAIVAAVDDSPLRSSLTIDADVLLRECTAAECDPFAQWVHEVTVDAALRHRVHESLPRRLVEVAVEMQARLHRSQSRPT